MQDATPTLVAGNVSLLMHSLGQPRITAHRFMSVRGSMQRFSTILALWVSKLAGTLGRRRV
jgi:hypothetical protein